MHSPPTAAYLATHSEVESTHIGSTTGLTGGSEGWLVVGEELFVPYLLTNKPPSENKPSLILVTQNSLHMCTLLVYMPTIVLST